MYTQCPECGVAFRVTAEVLKQAAGKVRCGGCGIAFNALEHLSEQKPAAPVKPAVTAEPNLPELTPEEPGELEADTPPQSISAEQSAALLKTLDQLAGSDIRIEDTGVEWRVLDEDEIDDEIVVEETDLIADTGSLKFIVEGEEDIVEDEPEPIEEMRFDDNTPLPDDFDFAGGPQADQAPVEAPQPEPEPVVEEAQVDLALGDPDEWQDLLGDLDEPAVEKEAKPVVDDVEEDLVSLAEAAAEEAASDDSEPDDAAADEPLDVDTQFAIQAEAMGIDLSGVHETVDKESQETEPEAAEQAEPELEEEAEVVDKTETSIEEDLIAAAFEAEAALKASADVDDEMVGDDEGATEEPELAEEEEEIEIDIDTEIEPVDEEEIEDDVEVIASGFDDKVEEVIGTLSASLDEMDSDEPRPEQSPDEDDVSDEHVIPEMTEEEKTINMMIDQELFNIAVEDEDGFASTIVQVQPSKDVEEELEENKKQEPETGKEKEEESPLVETIIMEGDFVRGEIDKGKLAADRAITSAGLDDPGVSIPLKKTMRGILRGGDDQYHSSRPGAGVITGAIALLLLLGAQVMHQSREALATVPMFNQTVGPLYRMLGRPLTPTWDISGWRFEATKGSTEVTNELVDGEESDGTIPDDEVLTIYSRVGNKSDKALPYPLVHLSLTDRFEEIIGSRVLEPSEYLAENTDPRKPVPPGNTFNAVFSIDSPSAEATGFKLNVCYRLASGQLRCAIEDFK
jgi:predicted Zn finger-like uncharacterized protein